MSTDILSDIQYQTGLLNYEVPIGKGTLIEYVVLTALGDCIKESFNFPYDLTSKKLGELNVKSSARHNSKNGYVWTFGKKPESYIPNYYVCVALDEQYSKIVNVWIIPGDARVVGSHGIYVIDNVKGLKRVQKYSIDPSPYNEIFQSIDISSFPEFSNINNSDLIKQNKSIAKDIKDGRTVEDIEKEYGKEYYLKFLQWIDEHNLKKYFHPNTGIQGIFAGGYFIEITEDRFPVFNSFGKYLGYVDTNGRFIRKFKTKIDILRSEKSSKMKLVRDIIQTFTMSEGKISLERLKNECGRDDIEDIIDMFKKHGDLLYTNNEYKWIS